MNENRQHSRLVALAGSATIDALLGARRPLEHRIHELEMAGVGRQLQLDRAHIVDVPLAAIAEMVLHVAATTGRVRVAVMAEKLLEQRLRRLVQNVRQQIQPSAMRHPNHDRPRAGARAALDRLVDHRHQRVDTLDREPLHVHERQAEKSLEAVDLR